MMKKIFENPVLNISMFNEENVATSASQTAVDRATDAINTAAAASGNTVRETITVTW